MYADDLSVYAMGLDIQILADRVNSYVPTLLQFFKERDLIVSPEKATVALFTPQSNQSTGTLTDFDQWYNCSNSETTKNPRYDP